MTNSITITIDHVNFSLQEEHDFTWIKNIGTVFQVFDQQDSGNISFGVRNNKQKYFVKYAGAKPVNFNGQPDQAISALKKSVSIYQNLKHPTLINFKNAFSTESGYAVVFDWFDGECLHPHWKFGSREKYTNPKSPFYCFKQLDLEEKLKVLDRIFAFHVFVEAKNYVAVDFYDGSLLYNFENNEIKICDIDFYRHYPAINDIGKNFWGSDRFKAPEEYELNAPIDSVTNVFTLGAMAFCLIGGELDHSYSKWEANSRLYKIALKAVEVERNKRYQTVAEFYEAWNSQIVT